MEGRWPTLLRRDGISGSFLVGGESKGDSFRHVPWRGVDGRARAKAQRDADDGDARGRRHLLGGVVLALLALPRLEHRGKP
jgi:hypothetical protein